MQRPTFHTAIDIALDLASTRNYTIVDQPVYTDRYAKIPLNKSFGVEGDFFIRSQSVGVSFFSEDRILFHVIKSMLEDGAMKINIRGAAADHQLSLASAEEGKLPFYCMGIASGSLTKTGILISKDPDTYPLRAAQMATLLVTQWMDNMIPVIQAYSYINKVKLST